MKKTAISTLFFFICAILPATLFTPSLAAPLIETNLPDIGQRSQSVLSAQKEQLMGEIIMQKINGSGYVTTDPIINEYLRGLSRKFTTLIPAMPFKLHYFAVSTDEINAFAFFGGHVAVHTGLLNMVETESELAAVLAHETAHITQQHLARIVAKNRQITALTFAELLGALAIGALGAPEAGMHLANAAMAGHTQQLINFTREHEQEADRIGIEFLAKGGFDPAAMMSVFQRLSQKTFFRDHPPEYLLTHPVFESRIADAAHRAERFTYRQAPSTLFFHLARARIDAGKDEKTSKKLERLKEKLTARRYVNKTAAEYAYAIALSQAQKHAEAKAVLEGIEKNIPEYWIMELALAEAELGLGQTSGLHRLNRLYNAQPLNHAIVLYYAQALLNTKQPDQVLKILSKQQSLHPSDPILFELIARAYSAKNHPIELHQTQAEWHFVRSEYKEALRQLDLALEYAEKNKILAAKINARKESLKEFVKEQQKMSL